MVTSEKIRGMTETPLSRLEGTLIVQRGQAILLTASRAAEIVARRRIDIFDAKTNPDGYQRNPSQPRVNRAARYYAGSEDRRPGLMPNSLLVNIREEDFSKVRIRVTGGDQARFDEAVEKGGNWVGSGSVELPSDLPLWVYDGQHRVGALATVINELADFPVPLSITIGLDRQGEMREFYQVNNNAKPVPFDLALELLHNMAVGDPELAALLELTGADWTNRGIDVVRELSTLDGPWSDSIQQPNQKKQRSDRLTITQGQFVRSLRPVLELPLLVKAEPADIANIVNAYWTGIAEVLPEPFDWTQSPKEFFIQKGTGVVALHSVMPEAIEVLRARGDRLADSKAYAKVMERLPDLKAEVLDEDGVAYAVEGGDFWRSGISGVASQFNGDAGRKRLGVTIRYLMPNPAEELQL